MHACGSLCKMNATCWPSLHFLMITNEFEKYNLLLLAIRKPFSFSLLPPFFFCWPLFFFNHSITHLSHHFFRGITHCILCWDSWWISCCFTKVYSVVRASLHAEDSWWIRDSSLTNFTSEMTSKRAVFKVYLSPNQNSNIYHWILSLYTGFLCNWRSGLHFHFSNLWKISHTSDPKEGHFNISYVLQDRKRTVYQINHNPI